MNTTSFQRDIPVDSQYDVIVAGGGPSGCGAALAAARDGARTMLLEGSNALGGNMTTALVTVWAPFGDEDPASTACYHGGLAYSVMSECRAGMPHVAPTRLNWVPADPELLKRIYDRRLTEAGVTVLFDTVSAAVETEQLADGRRVKYLVTASKAGLSAYTARMYIDCTGDADIAARAGAEILQGAEGDKLEVQPTSLCFILANVDDYALLHGPRIFGGDPASTIGQMIASGRYPEIKDAHLCNAQIGPGVHTFNAGHIWDVDGTDPASVSRALMEGRRIADAFLRGLAEFHPKAFANAYLVATAPRLGVRESRRIVGEYYLTLHDYQSRRSFRDDVARNHYWIDVHTSKSEIAEASKDWGVIVHRFEHFGTGESHGIPYRCMVPKGLTNILVPGRAISADRMVLGATRTMPCSMNLGEAAGAATAQLVQRDLTDVRLVDIERLRADLVGYGGYLPAAPSEQPAVPNGR